ncbi:AarF/UbiB family protein [Isoptericola sp. b490]|uniref:ABC1 kinase family protein n=1 Tax=Actinotalea lenta TaxID=3064654 RepID=UPI0027137A8E|nr:AarF/UbiB family protein [Isoptericola sp. b490]MDO8120620.1 AarF/UbiB family protein [Isoptericola sp. b490]
MTSSLRGRYRHILRFFAGVIARFLWWDVVLRRVGLRRRVLRTRPERYRREAARFRALAIRMGGVMIKIGQFLSSRLDVLPREITDELANLQDEVPAEDFSAIAALAQEELGAPITRLFAHVDPEPLAAASLGQVHRARLGPGHGTEFVDVVIKVQRPGIAAVVETDLAALARVARWLMRYRPIRTHSDVPALLREFSVTLHEEIDYQLEAENAATFLANFADHPEVRVPRVVRELSAMRVLTLEDVSAIKITDYDAITAAGIDRGDVARRLLATYLQQIFEDGFVHADPHPGNLFVTPVDGDGPPRWKLTFVDFGMVSRIPDSVRDSLRELLIAVGTRDAGRVVRAYQMLDMLLPGADLAAIERAEAQVFDRYWGLSMNELRNIDPQEVREFAHQYRDLLLDMPFQVPQNLLYVVRTVAILSGMCTGLDPDFNLWSQLGPFARKLVADETSSGLDRWLDQLGDTLMAAVALPGQATRVLTQIESRGLAVRDEQATRSLRTLRRSVDRLSTTVAGAALLVAGAVLVAAADDGVGIALMAVAGAVFLWAAASGARR